MPAAPAITGKIPISSPITTNARDSTLLLCSVSLSVTAFGSKLFVRLHSFCDCVDASLGRGGVSRLLDLGLIGGNNEVPKDSARYCFST